MNTTKNIHDRIKALVAIKADGKNTLLAKHLGVSEANIRGYIKGIMPKADVLDKIARCYDDISLDWLLTGRGPMLLPQDATKEGTAKPAYRSPMTEESDGIPLIRQQVCQCLVYKPYGGQQRQLYDIQLSP